MPIYEIGGYRVKPTAVERVKQAITEFVRYVQENEPGTKMYLAWQEKNDPTRFLHLFIFEDDAAQRHHGESAAVKQFESVYSPELVEGDVLFTDYEMILGKPTEQQWRKAPSGAKTAATKSKGTPKNKKRSRR
jgi:quinol monooxygenase YgiN